MVELEWFGEERIRAMNNAMKKAIIRSGNLVEATQKRTVPVDTGNLRSSIDQVFESDLTVSVGTIVDYAVNVEFPTRYTRAQPFVRPSLLNNKRNIIDIAKQEGERAID